MFILLVIKNDIYLENSQNFDLESSLKFAIRRGELFFPVFYRLNVILRLSGLLLLQLYKNLKYFFTILIFPKMNKLLFLLEHYDKDVRCNITGRFENILKIKP